MIIDLLNEPDAARVLGVSRDRLREMVEDGALTPYYRNQRGLWFHPDSLDTSPPDPPPRPAACVPAPVSGEVEGVLTRGEVARIIGVGPATVTRWAQNGTLPTVRTPGGHYRYPRSGVEALLAAANLVEANATTGDAGQPRVGGAADRLMDKRTARSNPAVCAVEGCEQTAAARGWCKTPYARWLRHGDALAEVPVGQLPKGPKRTQPDTCSVPGCDRALEARQLCKAHYQRLRVHGDALAEVPLGKLPAGPRRTTPAACTVERCGREPAAKSLCWMHYRRLRVYGDVHADVPAGSTPQAQQRRRAREQQRQARQEHARNRDREYLAAVDAAIADHGSIGAIPSTDPAARRLYINRVYLRDGTGPAWLRDQLAERGLTPAAPRRQRRAGAYRDGDVCAVKGCGQRRGGRLWCARHYHAWVMRGSPLPRGGWRTCAVAGCGKRRYSATWCRTHARAAEEGHGRRAYRSRRLDCRGRCAVCRADHRESQREAQRSRAEAEFPFSARKDLIAQLWEGAAVDEACAAAGITPDRLHQIAPLWHGFPEALDDALQAAPAPHRAAHEFRADDTPQPLTAAPPAPEPRQAPEEGKEGLP